VFNKAVFMISKSSVYQMVDSRSSTRKVVEKKCKQCSSRKTVVTCRQKESSLIKQVIVDYEWWVCSKKVLRKNSSSIVVKNSKQTQ
jgi:hypothetical protein